MTKVSIVTCYYNRASLVDRTVSSILAQTYGDFEALLVNDGSSDATAQNMLSYGDPRLRVLDHGNMGFTESVIDAISQAHGEYIAILGSGDEALPERIARQAAYLDANPDVVALGVRFNLHHSADRVTTSRADLGTDPAKTLMSESIYGHSEVMFRKSVYDAVGGYRPFFKFSQDNDLWLRLSERGKLALIPEVHQNIYKLDDGVTVAPAKMLMSKRCRDFAVFCARERRAGRPDPLTKHGPVAALMRPRSAHLGKRLVADAIRYIIAGNTADARICLEAAAEEGLWLRAKALSVLLKMPTVSSTVLKVMLSGYREIKGLRRGSARPRKA